jgi:hypothetical protein
MAVLLHYYPEQAKNTHNPPTVTNGPLCDLKLHLRFTDESSHLPVAAYHHLMVGFPLTRGRQPLAGKYRGTVPSPGCPGEDAWLLGGGVELMAGVLGQQHHADLVHVSG